MSTERKQCPLCAEWFYALDGHMRRAHGITIGDWQLTVEPDTYDYTGILKELENEKDFWKNT